MNFFRILFFFFTWANIVCAQNTHRIIFNPSFHHSTLQLNKYYLINQSDSIQFTALKFYISNIRYYKNKFVVYKEPESFHLIDIAKPKTLNVLIKQHKDIDYDQITFNLGIDSLTNVSGVMGGDLDPTNGMYWTWQSGYINFKLEGSSNLCPTRLNAFQFHLGGYTFPYSALQTLHFSNQAQKVFILTLDMSKLISGIDLKSTNHMMSPSIDAVKLSGLVKDALIMKEK